MIVFSSSVIETAETKLIENSAENLLMKENFSGRKLKSGEPPHHGCHTYIGLVGKLMFVNNVLSFICTECWEACECVCLPACMSVCLCPFFICFIVYNKVFKMWLLFVCTYFRLLFCSCSTYTQHRMRNKKWMGGSERVHKKLMKLGDGGSGGVRGIHHAIFHRWNKLWQVVYGFIFGRKVFWPYIFIWSDIQQQTHK